MISFFDKLLRMERREGGATVNLVERFMSTHPATEERIQALRDKYGSGRPASAA
jgi:predicted Zn-dependent protease